MPGVVDQHAYTRVFTQPRFDPSKGIGLGEVGDQHLDGNGEVLAQAGSQRLQARLVAGDQHQVVTALGEAFGIGGADTAGGTGDENGRQGTHGKSSRWVATPDRGGPGFYDYDHHLIMSTF